MNLKPLYAATIAFAMALSLPLSAFAQQVVQGEQIDCEDEANQDDDACLGLPPTGVPITNFVPLLTPLLGAGAVAGAIAAVAGGGGSTNSTPSTN